MKVAIVTTHPIQYQVPWIQRLAARQGIDLHVFFAMLPDALEQGRDFGVAFSWDLPLLDGYSYSVLRNVAKRPTPTEFAGCDTPEIHDELRKGRFDAVIVNGWVAKSCLQALWACRRLGIPCIVRGEANGLRPRAGWKRLLHRLLLSQYAAYLAIGTNNRDYYLASGVAPGRIFSTPYCVDNDRFGAAAQQSRDQLGRDELCRRFGLDPERATFLFSGKFIDKKRPGDIIEAVRRIGSHSPVQVLMVGGGTLASQLEAAAEGLPVRFAGFLNQSEISRAYATADCLVLPSDHGETWGLVVNEAMASGVAALVSDQVGCAVDLVTPDVTGDVFACGDVDELARAMARLSHDRRLLERMGQAAKERVQTQYNFDQVVDGVLAALQSTKKGAA